MTMAASCSRPKNSAASRSASRPSAPKAARPGYGGGGMPSGGGTLEALLQAVHLSAQRDLQQGHAATVPQRAVDVVDLELDRPGVVAAVAAAPDVVQDHAQVPVLQA